MSFGHTSDYSPRNVLNTVTWNELPEWQKDNEFIVSGYRRFVIYFFFPFAEIRILTRQILTGYKTAGRDALYPSFLVSKIR